MIPARTPFFLPWLYPSLTWRIPEASKSIFLTFDDGPIPGPTDFVMETLQKFSVTGTFFCIGDNIRKHPTVFSNLVTAGHAVANHTYHHLNGWRTDVNDYVNDVRQCNLEFASHAQQTTLFRPPYGQISRRQIAALTEYKIVMWDVLTRDYSASLQPESCLKRSVAATRDGSIVVFHDSLKAERNLRFTLPRYIEYFLERGYVFKKIEP